MEIVLKILVTKNKFHVAAYDTLYSGLIPVVHAILETDLFTGS
jgi:hypothetical protein